MDLSRTRPPRADRRGRGLVPAFKALAVLALAAAALAAPLRCAAHAGLEKSEPAPGAVLRTGQPPSKVSLYFTEPVEVANNAVAVLNAEHKRVERLNAHIAP